MNLTISDIAKLANVSKSAVSLAINNKPGVSEKTRKKIIDIIEKYNFKPNQLAQSLVANKTNSIGLIITEIDNPFFSKVTKGVYDTCSNLGYTVIIGSSELDPMKEQEIISAFKRKRIDGLIISPLRGQGVDYRYISNLLVDEIPFVMLRNVVNYSINLVDIDNINAAYKAVNYLIKLGHKKIAFFSGPVHSGHNTERLEGYKKALNNNGIVLNKHFIIKAGSYLENGYAAGKELFNKCSNDLPTAIFCYNDLVAIGLMRYLDENEIKVPEQISIMGFDNIDFSGFIKTPLTTINMPAYNIGQKATELLISKISAPNEKTNIVEFLDAELIERQSCRKVV